MKRIRKEDKVIVITGKDRGKTGTVKKLLSAGKVIVSGVNIVKRHTKPNPNIGKAGGILDKEMPIDISNIALFNSETGKADKIGFKFDESKKLRYYKSTGKVVES